MTTPYSTTTAAARFLLLGDSHAGPIGRAAEAAGIPFRGGPIGAGREFSAEFFDVCDGDFVFRAAEPQAYYRRFLAELGVSRIGELTIPVVSTFGLSVHFYATIENWNIYRARGGGFATGFLSSRLFDGIVRAMARGALEFHRHARRLGLRVLAVLPPQRVPPLSDPEVFMAAQDTMAGALAGLGVEIVDLRARATDETGRQRAALSDTRDPIHGNLAFGRLILADLLARGL